MNINRQDYEELFLMYVDNELTAAQRTEVEVFVKQNPDLAEELVMLQESVLSPDQITFTGKEELYKTEESININNYQEYFLLDVDNELSATEKQDVEKFVLQHPQLQEEFTLLHQTKLEPEVIEFKNKASLYRTEERRRVIPMNFVRFAVAASVIGLIATLWFVYPGEKQSTQPLASNEIPAVVKPGSDVTQQPIETRIEEPAEETINKEVILASTKPVGQKHKASINVANTGTRVPENEPEKAEPIFAGVQPKQQTQREDLYSETNKATITSEPAMAITASNNNITNTNSSYAKPAVYKEVDMEEEDNSFYIGSAEINKAKLRGLLKKAANLFDKKAKTDDSEKTIRIASFEIKTK